MLSLVRNLVRRKSGNVAIIFGLALLPVMGAVGAAVDFYRISSTRTQMQNAVDAAALAAVIRRTGSDAVRLQAAQASFDGNYGGNPVATLSGVGGTGLYTASAEATLPMSIMGLFGIDTVPIRVAATAEKTYENDPPCVLALNGASAGAVTLTGTAEFTATNCVVYSNSRDVNGMKIQGSAAVVADGFCSAGGVQTNQTITPSPLEWCEPADDPLAHIPAPQYGGCDHNNVSVGPNQTRNLSPGVYCGGMDIRGTANFADGTYVIRNGQLKINSQATAEGENLLFYFTGNQAGFDVNGGAGLSLKANLSGDHGGILFMQDRMSNPGATNTLNGNSEGTLVGAIYTPTQGVKLNGSSDFGQKSPYMPIIADEVEISGSTQIRIDVTGMDLPYTLPNTESGVRISR